ncbi:MAG: SRPBCC family protein [Actinomycetota bacterium]|nr:SRPBCC family protein [Actinomycetota bacterium]
MAESPAPLSESILITAPPERVWDVVSDLRRMGERSPECRKVILWGRARRQGVRLGSRLTGFNRRKFVLWPTTSTVHRYDEGRAIGWRVFESQAQWTYELSPEGDGTVLTEAREMPDPVPLLPAVFARIFLGGFAGHDVELREGMKTTLRRIKAEVEG